MIADLFVYELGDLILLTMAGDVAATVLDRLDRFIFSEDVQLGDVSGTFAVCRDRSSSREGGGRCPRRHPWSCCRHRRTANLKYRSDRGDRRARDDTSEPGFDIFVEQGRRRVLVDLQRRRDADRRGDGRRRTY